MVTASFQSLRDLVLHHAARQGWRTQRSIATRCEIDETAFSRFLDGKQDLGAWPTFELFRRVRIPVEQYPLAFELLGREQRLAKNLSRQHARRPGDTLEGPLSSLDRAVRSAPQRAVPPELTSAEPPAAMPMPTGAMPPLPEAMPPGAPPPFPEAAPPAGTVPPYQPPASYPPPASADGPYWELPYDPRSRRARLRALLARIGGVLAGLVVGLLALYLLYSAVGFGRMLAIVAVVLAAVAVLKLAPRVARAPRHARPPRRDVAALARARGIGSPRDLPAETAAELFSAERFTGREIAAFFAASMRNA